MLDQIKSLLHDSTVKPFFQFYSEYVMSVQDSCLSKEINFLQSNNTLDVRTLDNLIAMSYEKHGGTYDKLS